MKYVVKRIYRVRVKWCWIAVLMWAVTVMFTFLTFLDAGFWPLMVFLLVDLILTVVPAYYVEVLDVNS